MIGFDVYYSVCTLRNKANMFPPLTNIAKSDTTKAIILLLDALDKQHEWIKFDFDFLL